jgi:hypothetical protein
MYNDLLYEICLFVRRDNLMKLNKVAKRSRLIYDREVRLFISYNYDCDITYGKTPVLPAFSLRIRYNDPIKSFEYFHMLYHNFVIGNMNKAIQLINNKQRNIVILFIAFYFNITFTKNKALFKLLINHIKNALWIHYLSDEDPCPIYLYPQGDNFVRYRIILNIINQLYNSNGISKRYILAISIQLIHILIDVDAKLIDNIIYNTLMEIDNRNKYGELHIFRYCLQRSNCIKYIRLFNQACFSNRYTYIKYLLKLHHAELSKTNTLFSKNHMLYKLGWYHFIDDSNILSIDMDMILKRNIMNFLTDKSVETIRLLLEYGVSQECIKDVIFRLNQKDIINNNTPYLYTMIKHMLMQYKK